MPIDRLTIANLLSFGPTPTTVELRPLNVLIGANGSGKSNLIDVLSILAALPTDIRAPFRAGGGALRDWFWNGAEGVAPEGDVTAAVNGQLSHHLVFAEHGFRVRVTDEWVHAGDLEGGLDRETIFGHVAGIPSFADALDHGVMVASPGLSDGQSVLAQRTDARYDPELATLRATYAGIHIFRGWDWGRDSALRRPQRTDLPSDFVLPSAENLAVVLNQLSLQAGPWSELLESMQQFLPGFRDIKFQAVGATLLLHFVMDGAAGPIGTSRLSTGTLQYLTLLAILLHPTPPPLIAIEEPETALHPDLISDLARLLVAASERTQVVITTHSDHLVDALSADPAAILVAEREAEGTTLRRLDAEKLKLWLADYRLGEIWMTGHLGGTRW